MVGRLSDGFVDRGSSRGSPGINCGRPKPLGMLKRTRHSEPITVGLSVATYMVRIRKRLLEINPFSVNLAMGFFNLFAVYILSKLPSFACSSAEILRVQTIPIAEHSGNPIGTRILFDHGLVRAAVKTGEMEKSERIPINRDSFVKRTLEGPVIDIPWGDIKAWVVQDP